MWVRNISGLRSLEERRPGRASRAVGAGWMHFSASDDRARRNWAFPIPAHLVFSESHSRPLRLGGPAGKEKSLIGNWYCTQFKDAWEVAERVDQHLPELESRTRAFVDALRRSTVTRPREGSGQRESRALSSRTRAFASPMAASRDLKAAGIMPGLASAPALTSGTTRSPRNFSFPRLRGRCARPASAMPPTQRATWTFATSCHPARNTGRGGRRWPDGPDREAVL